VVPAREAAVGHAGLFLRVQLSVSGSVNIRRGKSGLECEYHGFRYSLASNEHTPTGIAVAVTFQYILN